MDENFSGNSSDSKKTDPQNMNKIFGLNRNVLLLIILILIWLAIVIIFYGPQIVTYFGIPGEPTAVAEQAHLGIFPETLTCQREGSCQVEVRVDTAQTDVVAVRAIVKYDQNVLTATSIDASGSAFTYEVENEIDNSIGEIRIARGEPTSGVNNNNALVATINFTVEADAATGNTIISFGSTNQTPTGNSDVIKDDGACSAPEQTCSGGTDLFADSRGHSATITIEAEGYDPDLNNDGNVNITDLTQYVVAYRNSSSAADVNNDGNVNITDLTQYVVAYRAAQ